MLKKAGQQGRSKRRGEAYSVRYGEPLSEARTPLTDFFSILLKVRLLRRIRSRSRRLFPEARMPHPAERNKGMIQINNWLGECRRWPLLCTVLLLTVLLVTAGSEADVTII
jgi:hypothetical protein